MRVHVAVDANDNHAIVTVDGEIDVTLVPSLREALHDQISAGRSTIEVDLFGVSFIDSTGVGVLVGAHSRMTDQGLNLIVSRVQPSVLRVFRTTGLTGVMDIRPADGVTLDQKRDPG